MATIEDLVVSVAGGLILYWLLRRKLASGWTGGLVCLLLVYILTRTATEVGVGHWTWGPKDVEGNGDRKEEQSQDYGTQAYRGDEQLSMLVFNAISTEPARSVYGAPAIDHRFYWAVNQIKRVLNDCSIDAREYWTNRRIRQRTQVLYGGPRAADAAQEIAGLLPGNQDIRSLEQSGLWGIHDDRDIVLLLGSDAGSIEEGLRETENRSCPRLVGQPATG